MKDSVTDRRTYQKSLLAKLLARENIQVEIQNVSTAMFDVRDRILVIPKLKDDISESVYNMYIGHEVSHALNTPANGWGEIIKTKIPNVIVQIVEDSRIEKLIKNEYPGIRQDFFFGWRELFDNGSFATKTLEEANNSNFLDRYNMHFKLGDSFGIVFSNDENEFIQKGKSIVTWEEATQLMHEIHNFVKGKKEKKKKESFTINQEYESESGGTESGPLGDDDLGDDNEGPGLGDNEITSKTFEALEKAKTHMFDKVNINICNVYAHEPDWKGHVLTYRKIIEYDNGKFRKTSIIKYQEFSKPYVNYMVQQFKLKMNAQEMKLISFNRTGNLDLDRIHEYSISDDIFIKNSIQNKGKSHGLVLFMDWSGSMQVNLTKSLYQCFFLTDFCRKLDIPFEVYAFTNSHQALPVIDRHKVGDLAPSSYMLANILSSKMTMVEYQYMQQILLNVGDNTKIHPFLGLGGTPLNEAIIAAMEIVPEFKEENKIDVVNICFITDGEGGSMSGIYDHGKNKIKQIGSYKNIYIHDRKTHNVEKTTIDQMSVTLLRLLQKRTDTNIIGFYLSSAFAIQFGRLSPYYEELRKKHVATVYGVEGYTHYHIIDNIIINTTPNKNSLLIHVGLKFILGQFIKLIT